MLHPHPGEELVELVLEESTQANGKTDGCEHQFGPGILTEAAVIIPDPRFPPDQSASKTGRLLLQSFFLRDGNFFLDSK